MADFMGRKPSEFGEHPTSFDQAQSKGRVRGWCKHVVDGDTIDCLLDLGFGVYAYVALRLRGVDCPEMHGSNEAEQVLAEQAKAFVIRAVWNKPVLVRSWRDTETIGRWVADVDFWSSSSPAPYDLASELVKAKLTKADVR